MRSSKKNYFRFSRFFFLLLSQNYFQKNSLGLGKFSQQKMAKIDVFFHKCQTTEKCSKKIKPAHWVPITITGEETGFYFQFFQGKFCVFFKICEFSPKTTFLQSDDQKHFFLILVHFDIRGRMDGTVATPRANCPTDVSRQQYGQLLVLWTRSKLSSIIIYCL